MDRPVTIGNVHNMSLEGLRDQSDVYPHLVAQFSCETEVHDCILLHDLSHWTRYVLYFKVCCSAVWLFDMYNVTVKGIGITVQMSNKPISGVILNNVSDITVQLNATCSLADQISFGITIFEATSVDVHSSSTSNCSVGLVLLNTTNIYITRVTAMYNELVGIALNNTIDSHISNTVTAHNAGRGMSLINMNNTHITNTSTSHNGRLGISLYNMSNTYITNMISAHNNEPGMYLQAMINTFLTNTTTMHNDGDGMGLVTMTNTHMTNTTTKCNVWNGMELALMNNTHITDTTAIHNGGVGMYLVTSSNIHITKTTATHNGGHGNAHIGVFDGQLVIASSTILIYNTSFTDVSTQHASSTANPANLPAVIVLYKSTLHISGCNFTRNNISAIGAYASLITVSSDLTFSNNEALVGTAFILIQESILTFEANSHIYFLKNHATNTGGVFYITSYNTHLYWNRFNQLYSRTTCFINTEGSRSQTRFTFANNSAGKGGDILYGGQVALGLDGDWNCLDSFKEISNISQNGLSLISSDPLRVCLCSARGQPDCPVLLDPTPHTIYPGQTITISAAVVGQDFGTVAGSVYAQFLQRGSPPHLESGQEVQGVTQRNCNRLRYTIFSQSKVAEEVLVLTAHDSYVSELNDVDYSDINNTLRYYYETQAVKPLVYSNSPVYVNISILPCPPGFMLTSHSPFRCDCNSLLQQMHGIQCNIQEQTIGRSGLLWVGMIQDDNGINGTVAASD